MHADDADAADDPDDPDDPDSRHSMSRDVFDEISWGRHLGQQYRMRRFSLDGVACHVPWIDCLLPLRQRQSQR